MDELLEKQESAERDIRQALVYFQSGFQKGGLSLQEIYAAMDEFEPILRQLIRPHQTRFQIPDRLGLTPAQAAAVRKAHEECMQSTVLHYRKNIWQGLKIIAGLIGRQNYNS